MSLNVNCHKAMAVAVFIAGPFKQKGKSAEIALRNSFKTQDTQFF